MTQYEIYNNYQLHMHLNWNDLQPKGVGLVVC
jgi:hypothetical protein